METNWVPAFLAIVLVVAFLFFMALNRLHIGRRSSIDREHYENQWARIQRLKDGSEAEWHLAIFEADKLLDQALKASGYGGQTMGDRLKHARKRLRNNDAVWQAHKLRNKLAHESGVHLDQAQVAKALNGIILALQDLGVLR